MIATKRECRMFHVHACPHLLVHIKTCKYANTEIQIDNYGKVQQSKTRAQFKTTVSVAYSIFLATNIEFRNVPRNRANE